MIISEDILTHLDQISQEQGLGLKAEELTLIIRCEDVLYYPCLIVKESSDYVSIVQTNEYGEEYCKVLRKEYITQVVILYQQMLEEKPEPKKDNRMHW